MPKNHNELCAGVQPHASSINHERTCAEFSAGRQPLTERERAVAYRATAVAVRIMQPSPDQMATMLEQWADVQDAIGTYKATKCSATCAHGRPCSWHAVVGTLCRTHYRQEQRQQESDSFTAELDRIELEFESPGDQ